MRYDPILCMNVPDRNKAKDEGLKVTSYVINKGQSGEYYGLKNKETNQVLYSAPNNWKSREGAKRWAEKKGMTYVEDSDVKSIDKAIKNCDEEKKESYPELTISNAKIGNKYSYPGGWIKLTKVWKMSEKEMKEKGLNYPWRWEGISNKGYKEGAALTH